MPLLTKGYHITEDGNQRTIELSDFASQFSSRQSILLDTNYRNIVLVVRTRNSSQPPLGLQGGPKIAPFLYALTSSDINRFSKLFHSQNYQKNCTNTITKALPTPQWCRYTTL